jgi:hypothetical protein
MPKSFNRRYIWLLALLVGSHDPNLEQVLYILD